MSCHLQGIGEDAMSKPLWERPHLDLLALGAAAEGGVLKKRTEYYPTSTVNGGTIFGALSPA